MNEQFLMCFTGLPIATKGKPRTEGRVMEIAPIAGVRADTLQQRLKFENAPHPRIEIEGALCHGDEPSSPGDETADGNPSREPANGGEATAESPLTGGSDESTIHVVA